MRVACPTNEDDFEELCLRLLRLCWSCETLTRYGHRGERQHGVDLWDAAGVQPVRAVQCKHHALHKTLPPAELQAEVERAKAFPHKFDHLFVLTSAKRSTATQDAETEINQRHTTQGLFTVHVWFWDDIERVIDNYPEIQQRLGMTSPHALTELLSGVVATAPNLAGDFGDRSADIKKLIARGRLDDAQEAIERLKMRSWHQLLPIQQARILTHEAVVHANTADQAAAARLLLKARDLAPDDEHTNANSVLAYEWLADQPSADRAAEQVVDRFPNSAAARAVWVRTRAKAGKLDETVDELPAWAKASTEVAVAVAEGYLQTGNVEAAERWARAAVACEIADPELWCRVGQTWLGGMMRGARPEWKPPTSDEAEELVGVLAKGVECAKENRADTCAAECLRLAAIAQSLVGRVADAERLFAEAFEFHASDELRLAYTRFLLTTGQNGKALQHASRTKHGGEVGRLLHAISLWLAGTGDEREQATAALTEIALDDALDTSTRSEALGFAVESLVSSQRFDEAERILAMCGSLPTRAANATLLARVRMERGQTESARTLALEALANLKGGEAPEVLRLLALILTSVGLRAQALELWLQLVPNDRLEDDTYRLFQLAMQLRRDDVVLSRAARLREVGIYDERILDAELSLLERYDADRCLDVLMSALALRPTDPMLLLRRSLVGIRANRPELVCADVSLLPSAEDVTPEIGRFVVGVMLHAGQRRHAVDYAYELVRRNYRNLHAHAALRESLLLAKGEIDLGDHSAVQADSAVEVREQGDGVRWLVLTGADPLLPDECDVNSPLGLRMLGRTVGDEVVLSEGAGAKRLGTILSIKPRQLHRLHRSMAELELLFPDGAGAWVVHVGDGQGGINIEPILEIAKRAHERAEAAMAYFDAHPEVPLSALAQMLGRDELTVMAELAASDDRTVRCAGGSAEQQAEAQRVLSTATCVVIHLSAISTILLLEADELLRALPFPLVVAPGTVERLREAIATDTLLVDSAGQLAFHEGRLVYARDTGERREARKQRLQHVLDNLQGRARVKAASNLPGWEPERRKLVSDFFGWHGAQSIDLATEPGAVLWSDDFAVAHFAIRDWGARAVCTQMVGRFCNERGLLPDDSYATLGAKLVGAGYDFTSVNAAILRKSGALADWRTDRWPLRQAIRYAARGDLHPEFSARVALPLLVAGYQNLALPQSREQLATNIFETIAGRPDAKRVFQIVGRDLQQAFGLDLLNQERAQHTFRAWVRSRAIW